MRYILLLITLLLSSCTSTEVEKKYFIKEVQPFGSTVQISTVAEFSPETTAKALLIFIEAWVEMFGEEDRKMVVDILSNLTIEYMEENWIIYPNKIYSENGEESPDSEKGVLVRGLCLSRTKIQVAVNRQHISYSSLAHELVHVVLYNIRPETFGDPDHLGDEYEGWTDLHSLLKDTVNLQFAFYL